MSIRLHYLLGFLIISGLIGVSLYLQFYDGVEPCPLCTLQRLSFFALGLLFFLGLIFASFKFMRYFLNIFLVLFSLVGMFLAGRQVWIQHFPPPGNAECGVSLQYMMQVLPFNQLIQKILEGSAECTKGGGFTFLSLNMAEWSLIWFVLFFCFAIYLFSREKAKIS
jgi:disulfide bond formation protein DsbB